MVRSCCRKTAVWENMMNMEKLVIRLCDDDKLHGYVTFQRNTRSVCGYFGRDWELWHRWVRIWSWLTESSVDGTVRRIVPVSCSVSKEDGTRSTLSHKPVKLAVAINFVLWASERLDFKFSLLKRVANFNSFFPAFLTAQIIKTLGTFPPCTSCEMYI